MKLRKPPPPRTPEENRARNSARLMNPPGPTMGELIALRWHAATEWCWRRRHREFAALLDRARLLPLDHPAYGALRESVRQQRNDGGAAGRDEPPPA